MTSTLTGAGWYVDPNVVDQRIYPQTFTTAQIAAMNAQIAAGGGTDVRVGTRIIESSTGAIYVKKGVGTGAQFVSVGSAGALPNFVFQAETTAFVTAQTTAGSAPNSRRQKSQNRMIKRLKDGGVWAKISHLYLLASDSTAQALINVRNPGTNDLTVNGSPTFTQFRGYAFPAITAFLSTGVAPSALNQDSVSMGCFTRIPSGSFATSTYNMGSTDSSGTNGMSLVATNAKVPSGTFMTNAAGGTVTSDQGGMQAFSRTSSTVADLYHNSRLTDTVTSASTTAAAVTAPITIGKVNGRTTTCLQTISAAFIGAGMSLVEMQLVYAAVQDYLDKVDQGDMDINEAGFAPSLVTVDHIVYGATSNGLAYAYQLARDGESVAIVAGDREHQGSIGGMSTNGLGFADYRTFSALSGLAKTMVTAMNADMGVANNSSLFVPRYFLKQLRTMFDGARAGGYSVPIYITNGVVSGTKSGTRLQTITTLDGRTFAGKYWHDASYEGDLLAVAGITCNIGREAATTGTEAFNGNRGLLDVAGLGVAVSPYVTDGVPGSGLLDNVEVDATAVGAADDRVQSYNYRITAVQTATKKLPFPNTPPPGYSTSKYELHLRLMANGIATGLLDFLKIDNALPLNTFDLNTSGFFSTDYSSNKARAYTKAATPGATSYAAREVIRQDHINYTKGIFYLLGFDADSRVNSTIRTAMLTWGYDTYHYLDPHPSDSLHWMQQMYVREMRRMVGAFTLNAIDVTLNDGNTPRNTNTIAALSYTVDSHPNRNLVNTNTTPHSICAEGGIGIALPGDGVTPFPYEAAVPQASECTNVSASFCVSATHLAFGTTRMEYHAILIAQAMAVAAKLARTSGEINLQAVPYATLRTNLLAVQDAVAPNLPQLT